MTSTPRALTLDKRADGIAVVTFDVPGDSVNTLQATFADDFAEVFAKIEADDAIRAVVLRSGKKDNFVAGANIDMLRRAATPADAEALSRSGQRAMQRIEDLRVPVVAAIHGACLGGGLELAMACHARVASDSRKTQLGQPEVKLGLLPGAGGTQRLPRLVGVQAALDLMLTGKSLRAGKARSLGLVDDVVPEPILVDVAIDMARALADAPEPDRGALARVRDAVRHLLSTEDLQALALEDNPVGRKLLFDQARKKVLAQTHGNYPAPLAILEVVKTGLDKGLDAGYEAEAKAFGRLVASPEAKQLMGIFFATRALEKDSGVDDPSVEPRRVDKVGVLGAGLMGAGIAYVNSAVAGVRTRIKDKDDAGVGRGLAYIRGIHDERVARRRSTPRERLEKMALITATTDYTGFADCDVVIEAVFEDLELKQRVLRDIEDIGGDDVIFASNTSSIPIARIAEASRHPETVIGMHYFSPVHKMPLLEVIVTDATADWVTATCVALGKRQGKTVIVVRDGTGFYTSRILGPYMAEAAQLLAAGVPIDDIDAALIQFGFPVGPIALLDEVGIDVAHKVGQIAADAFGDRMPPMQGLDALIADGRHGRKNGKGFYRYDVPKKKGKRPVDDSVYAVLGVEPRTRMAPEEIARRCALQMVNEAAYCFGDGILRCARDGDIGAVFGLGFPPFRGGPFRYADALGIAALVDQLDRYAGEYGPRWAPAPVLRDMAAAGQTFHGPSAAPPRAATRRKSA
ncbi:MAG: fatty acid oxidation complex subunit alpha FadJ [Deltaproteobacteria bacterium]|nr:MAG: fatty acid oxidation complex subunit alpha FadJ [Deltaproteobacteria bacterium]